MRKYLETESKDIKVNRVYTDKMISQVEENYVENDIGTTNTIMKKLERRSEKF